MIEYSPWPRKNFGSVEQALHEAKALVELLQNPEAVSRIFEGLPGAIKGVCESERKAACNISVDAIEGHLRIICADTDLLPGEDDGVLIIHGEGK